MSTSWNNSPTYRTCPEYGLNVPSPDNTKVLSSANAFVARVALYPTVPIPCATKPLLPKELFELVRSHCPPAPQYIPMSVHIVKIETN